MIVSTFLICSAMATLLEAQVHHVEVEAHPHCPTVREFDQLSGRCPGWCLSDDHCMEGTICCPNHCGGSFCYRPASEREGKMMNEMVSHRSSRFSRLSTPFSLLTKFMLEDLLHITPPKPRRSRHSNPSFRGVH